MTILQEAGIDELYVSLGQKKSFTMAPPEAPHIPGATTVQVLLVASSFYVNKVLVTVDQWPEEAL